MEEKVILVDEQDNQIGLMSKMEAHEKAVLHRAFSVFIMNDRGETMLQQRAADKYHYPLLWTNIPAVVTDAMENAILTPENDV